MKAIEKSAKTVDKAIELALEELGLTRDQVEVDILQIESGGILGVFGKKEGRVRVTPLRGLRSSGDEQREETTRPRSRQRDPQPAKRQPTSERASKPQGRPAPSKAAAPPRQPQPPVAASRPAPSMSAPVMDDDDEPLAETLAPQATELLRNITSQFGLNVRVDAREDARAINLVVGGEDIGQLIGRRGRTLGAVQYLISRILNEDRPNKKKVLIDVDGYSENRERSLRETAERAKDRVLQTGKPYSLRPMTAPDRRVIHMTLQDHPQLATESFGDEGSRFVMVYPRSMRPDELERYAREAGDSEGGRPPRRDQGRYGRPPRGGDRPPRRDGPRRPGPRRPSAP